ncbi:hypothetical protein COOONC_12797 [Cooperia oncophora]
MDDDLVDVFIVLGVLGLGLIGLLILLATVVRSGNTIAAEEPRSTASKTPVSRVFSSPLPKAEHLPSPTRPKEHFIFIVPRSPTYRAEIAQSTTSPYQSTSTGSSYLPNQIPPLAKRRCSA